MQARVVGYVGRACVLLNPSHDGGSGSIICDGSQIPHLCPDVGHADRLASLQALIHFFFNQRHNGSQALVKHVGIVTGGIIAQAVTHQTLLTHAHTCINIVWFAINSYTNLHRSFFTFGRSVTMVKNQRYFYHLFIMSIVLNFNFLHSRWAKCLPIFLKCLPKCLPISGVLGNGG